MATISAADVKALREKTGLPMMECKQALVETDGDQSKAVEILRSRGSVAAAGKAGRETAEGRIGCYIADGVGGMVEVRCETAPVANNEDFMAMVEDLAKSAAHADTSDPAALLALPIPGDSSKTGQDRINDTLNKLRENMQLANAGKLLGSLASYVHHNGQVGAMVAFDGAVDADLGSAICMQVAAMSPLAVSRDRVDAALAAEELKIAKEQAAATGKPAEIAEKIAKGKLDKWFSQVALLEQPFVRDDKQSVGQVLKAAGSATVTDFIRMEVGLTA